MFDRLKKHHLGFVIAVEDRPRIESHFNKVFTYDHVQGTHVLFIYDKIARIYVEYICREGRVKYHEPGFAHICYTVKSNAELEQVEQFIHDKKMGFKLTDLEQSGSEECNHVKFYYLKHLGVIELNLVPME